MPAYRVIALAQEVADAVRATRLSPFSSHPTHVEIARGHGPCRLCLRAFAVGEDRRLLFTLDPFAGLEPLPLPGPVFIHEAACARHAEDAGFPEDIRTRQLTIQAYGAGRRLVGEEFLQDGNVDAVIDRLLARPDVLYLHVRDTAAGCYDFRVERAA
ncbi:MAG TPA: DUF1203 domain-containing protein [Gemmatimonadales bacterium]|jgi:hypothetical protein|nr:DUF1203 domain-containing protein [Gemmatimonadales bacterium]